MRLSPLLLALLLSSEVAVAQVYPERTVRVVVPFAAGGVVDTVARALSAHMQDKLGQPFVIENKGGAAGSLGAADVARAAPDGHTLLYVFDTHAVTADLLKNVPYDPIGSFEPISLVITSPLVMVARTNLPAEDFNGLVDLARKQQVSFASVGPGSLGHVAFEDLSARSGVKMAHVPYRGAAPALNDMIGGHVDIMLTTIGTSLEQIRGGKLKAITLLSDTRSKALPDLPTIKEQTGQSYEMISWVGFLAPAKTPPMVVSRLNEEVRRAFEAETMRTRFAALGFEIVTSPPAAFRAFLERNRAEVGAMIRKFGIQAQ